MSLCRFPNPINGRCAMIVLQSIDDAGWEAVVPALAGLYPAVISSGRRFANSDVGYGVTELSLRPNCSTTVCTPESLVINLRISGPAEMTEHVSSPDLQQARGAVPQGVDIYRPKAMVSRSWGDEWSCLSLNISNKLGRAVLGGYWRLLLENERLGLRADDVSLFHAMSSLYYGLRAQRSEESLFFDSLVNAIVARLPALASGPRAQLRPPRKLAESHLAVIVDYIEDNIGTRISLQMLAGLLGMHPAKFFRLFKARTGRTPYQYLMRQRVDKARSLLVDSNSRLSDLAISLGFYDQSQFNRIFRKCVGVTPGQYRSQHLT
jgi:AraC-like DNA-binding protein